MPRQDEQILVSTPLCLCYWGKLKQWSFRCIWCQRTYCRNYKGRSIPTSMPDCSIFGISMRMKTFQHQNFWRWSPPSQDLDQQLQTWKNTTCKHQEHCWPWYFWNMCEIFNRIEKHGVCSLLYMCLMGNYLLFRDCCLSIK